MIASAHAYTSDELESPESKLHCQAFTKKSTPIVYMIAETKQNLPEQLYYYINMPNIDASERTAFLVVRLLLHGYFGYVFFIRPQNLVNFRP